MTTGPDPADIFRQEAVDLLDQLEQALLDLEQDPAARPLVDLAFRVLHTIKGSGAMFGFDDIARFAHGFETAFDQVRKGQAPITPQLIALSLRAQDHIGSLLDGTGGTAAGEAILDDLRSSLTAVPGVEVDDVVATESVRPGTWAITMRFAPDVLGNGTNPLLLLDELATLGPCHVTALVDEVPPLEKLQPDTLTIGWRVLLTTEQSEAAIEDVFLFIHDDMELKIEAVAPDGAGSSGLPSPMPNTADVADEAVPSEVVSARRETEVKRGGKPRTSLRVQAERLDELMDRVGELVITQVRLTQMTNDNADLNVKVVAQDIERLVSGLRETTMSIRMVPIGSLFGRFRRLVHDLSRDLAKDVELLTIGEDTELDKTMVERLADPLVHLIRNAIDHGLETPEQRVQAGKAATGQVRLMARHSGAEVLISVSDDGRGLDAKRIKAKACEQGLISADANIPDQQVYQLLFQPGFSTAREVSAVSGRGVGMDVVKRTVEGLRGLIDITTVPCQGSEVTLRLPLTLAIIDGLLVRVGRARYVMPLVAVEECVELSVAEDNRSTERSFLNIRGALVPFLRLREVLATGTPPDPYQKVVVVSVGELRVGLVVDQIIGSHQTVIKSLSKLHTDLKIFSGATILGDGGVALIFDVLHLIERGRGQSETRSLQEALP